ncbi:hypothetical protein [Erwinia endophytica]|nr:hypothetical protein [Erwinia endophytica]
MQIKQSAVTRRIPTVGYYGNRHAIPQLLPTLDKTMASAASLA